VRGKIANCPYCGKILPRELWPEMCEVRKWGVKCPRCGDIKVWKAGKLYMESGAPVQRYLCTTCCYRFALK